MSTPLLYDRHRDWFRDLLQLATMRAATERSVEDTFRDGKAAADKELQTKRQSLTKARDRALADAEAKLQRVQRELAAKADADLQANDRELTETRLRVRNQFEAAEDAARTALSEAEISATAFFDAGEKESNETRLKFQQRARDGLTRAKTYWARADEVMAKVGRTTHELQSDKPPRCAAATAEDAAKVLDNATSSAQQFLKSASGLLLPRILPIGPSIALFIACCVLAAVPALFQKPPLLWLIGGVFSGAVLFVLLRTLVKWIGGNQTKYHGERLVRATELLEAAAERLKELADAEHEKVVGDLRSTQDKAMEAARGKHQPKIDSVEERRAYLQEQMGEKHRIAKERITQRKAEELRQAEEDNWATRAAVEGKFEDDITAAEEHHRERMHELKEAYDHGWRELTETWRGGIARLRAEFAALRGENDRLFPPWDAADWQNRPPVTEVPRGIRLGEFAFDLAKVPDGVPRDSRLKLDQPLRGRLPSFAAFPERCALLLKARDQGRGKAVSALQATMLRLLTAVPPGKVRFTIVDPVGLGDNFAAFMHLADHDELLVNSRIWTEPAHIDQRLADLTGHMENVIQKYLRHQFKSIEEYNAAAGEVAEPFRVLVVANFPANFTAEAARRLVSIVTSGSSCGVYALVSVDARAPLPHGFQLADLEQACTTLVWDGKDRFAYADEILSQFELTLDGPPDPVTTTRIVHAIGAQAKQASRVEVPFDFVAPRPEKVWTADSRGGVSVAIGRSGATKSQSLSLGKGTSQHGLIAGKTGSGKSTLLHALITNLALTYSPDEVELYLIDFKKGVEFKPYAEYRLPHARVVAIESEREFGLSVLQRLDAELKGRGDRFRQAGVTDVAAFRGERPSEKMPRILLVVDEFQEFFTEDDKLAQEAALLLDRLVRQGRAFGLHVLLGSQTLGGAYSLARSTIDQMAVRIALQCSEADAHLILSKDNAAARLLSRPGEAIYNDANGLVEGNDLFQVVWLPDERRESILKDLDARMQGQARPEPLVFEGNAPAEPAKNHLLERRLAAEEWPESPRAFTAWLGEAIAIKDPTCATFRPQSGSHLLMIGQHEEAATSLLAVSLVSLAAQHRPEEMATPLGGKFHVLDGTPADDPLAGVLARAADGLPHGVQFADAWGVAPMLAELADLIKQRQDRTATDRSTRYLIIHGLQRFRDLRKSDEDFGFRRGEKSTSPAENFATILREGPTVGVHLLMWFDTLTNVNRSLDRTMLRECTQRVLFQMSPTDSSHLIDSPAASRLGRNRALFHREEQDRPEKFRPYGLPPAEWLAWAKEQLRKRVAAPVAAT
ncbi:MAG: FtsK/SpoIIIE domain-containing protein [Gemmataceae bacterium]